MKAYHITQPITGLESLQQVELDQPEPGPGQVLIRVRAASLNYRDIAVVTGNYPVAIPDRGFIPLSDGAGEVEAVGAGVERVKVGDRVAGTFFQTWVDGRPPPGMAPLGVPLDGVLAEYVVLDQEGVVKVPEHLDFRAASTLPCAGVTAWHGLNVCDSVKPGDSVLLLGTGGVSIFSLQFAKLCGARVIITSSSDEKLERARELGADVGINYRTTPEWDKEVLKVTGGGVDHVVEVGGPGTLARSMNAVGFGGQVTLIGVVAGREGDTNPHALMFKYARMQGVFVGNRVMFEAMNRAIEVNKLQPVVDRVFPFDEAAQAFELLMAGEHFGKVVIDI